MASTDTAMSAATATTTTNTTAMSHPHLQAHNRTLSNISTEDLFSSITGFDDLAGDDDLSFDDVDDDDETGEGGKKGSGKKSGKIRNSSTAEKKATHNAVERARRESLNARFLVLADMLPGMTHVKRASKAAIVNKSIEFIREMHKAENRLVKENDALKAELEALRQRVNTSPGHNGGAAGPHNANGSALGLTNANAAHAQAHAQAAAAAAVAAAAAGMPPQHMPQHHLFPGMHPMQMQMPMMPHLPAAMASVAAAAAAHNGGNPTLGAGVHQTLPPAPTAENANKPAAHQQPAPPSAGLPAPTNAELGQHLFPGIFTGLFNAGGAFDNLEHARSESGSPAGSSISQQQHHQPGSRNGGSAQFSHGLFELPPMSGYTTEGGNKVGSPASYHSPPGTVASLAGSERTSQSQHSSSQLTNNTAPSPASSHSVPTPANAYSPLNLPGLTATPQSAHSLASQQAQAMTDPAIAAFDGSADAAYLAAQFAPGDLAKAQHELHAFIAYQQRMAYAGQQQQQQQQQSASGPQQHPSPTNGNGQMSPTLFPPHGSFGFQQQQAPQMPFAGVCGPTAQASMAGLPAWQMMMAQQQAMVAAYGQQGHY